MTIDIEVEGEMATLKETVSLTLRSIRRSVELIVSSPSSPRRLQGQLRKSSPFPPPLYSTESDLFLFQMVAQLTTFAREVTRVALEVGTYGQVRLISTRSLHLFLPLTSF